MLKGIVSSKIVVTAIFREEQDGNFRVECPEIPGCVVVARSKREATKRFKAAVEDCLAELLRDAKQKIRENKTRSAGRG